MLLGLLWQIMFQKKITKFYHLGNFLKSFKLKNAWNLNIWSVTRSSSSGTKLPTLAQTLLVGPKKREKKKSFANNGHYEKFGECRSYGSTGRATTGRISIDQMSFGQT